MAPKPYQVALAIPNASEPQTGIPTFGTLLTNNTGTSISVNSPAHPNLEFSITDFSQLYQQKTGHALTPTSVIGIGAFAGSDSDGGISEALFPENTFTLAQATVPVPPRNPTPSPPILINPHEHRIIDTSHRDLVRVSVFGTSGFPVSSINPATVELDGVAPIAHFTRKVRRDEFPFETFVFVANELKLPCRLDHSHPDGSDVQRRGVSDVEGCAQHPPFRQSLRPVEEVHGERLVLQEPGEVRGQAPVGRRSPTRARP